MVRIGVSVEGTTEEKFVKKVLVDHFSSLGIYLYPTQIQTPINIPRVRNEIAKMASSFDFVTTMYDFYGFKKLESGETRASLESKIKGSLDESIKAKVYPYIQMHEFEGILFSSPQKIAENLSGDNILTWSQTILTEFDNNPEKINNSPNTAPSKRLEANTSYKKTIDGPKIAKSIGVTTLREKCLGFNDWITMIERLSPYIS